jgi:hypothetical protein
VNQPPVVLGLRAAVVRPSDDSHPMRRDALGARTGEENYPAVADRADDLRAPIDAICPLDEVSTPGLLALQDGQCAARSENVQPGAHRPVGVGWRRSNRLASSARVERLTVLARSAESALPEARLPRDFGLEKRQLAYLRRFLDVAAFRGAPR